MKKFPENFWWGAAASGIQTEGSTNKANKSLWDFWFEKEPQKFYKEIPPFKVCDTYNRFREDVKLMADINFNSFRTSIQWGRLIKNLYTGEVCPDAVRFYNEYIDEMISRGIEPVINLYHFDIPSELQEELGGWENKKVIELFDLYAKQAFAHFGDRVKYWTTFNEPIVPVEGGYLYDFHYPNKKDIKLATQVAYNFMVAHARVVNSYKEMNLDGEIGVILNLTPTYTRDNRPEDLEAARIADLFFNKSFLDPMVKGEFPKDLLAILEEHDAMPKERSALEDEEILGAKVDFLGVNYYVPRRVRARIEKPEKFTEPEYYFEYHLKENGRFNPYRDGNEIHPEAIYDIAMNIKENYGNVRWYLAEIGIAMSLDSEGEVESGLIDDSFRTGLMVEHLDELHRAIADGANCFGVHQWTFIDNWSWINSFKRRYGFYRLNLETGAREIKKHALWFKEVAKNNGY